MFYHVSKKDLGSVVTLIPKVPESSLISKEGNIPRICVSTHIYFCLRSITGGSSSKFNVNEILHEIRDDIQPMEESLEWKNRGACFVSPAIYTCDEEAFVPPDACDFKKNNENWYIQNQSFKRIGYLHLHRLIMDGQIKLVEYPHTLDGKYLDNADAMGLKVVKDNQKKLFC